MSHTECTEYTELFLDRRTEGYIYFSRKGAEGAKLYVLLFFCLKPNGTHSKRRDVIPWRLPLTQTVQRHADFIVSHGNHGMHRKASRYASHHAEVGASRASKILCILWFPCETRKMSESVSAMSASSAWDVKKRREAKICSYVLLSKKNLRLPTMWAPFGAYYFREHEFHEWHE